MGRDVLMQRLRELRDAHVGGPIPSWLAQPNYGLELSAVAAEALAEIEFLQGQLEAAKLRQDSCNAS